MARRTAEVLGASVLVSDDDGRDHPLPYQRLAAGVVRQAIADAQKGDARAQAFLRRFSHTLWSELLPDEVVRRITALSWA